jgi:hypothetical protein
MDGMRLVTRLLILAVLTCTALVARANDFPLEGSKITLKGGTKAAKRRIAFEGKFAGSLGDMNPNFDGSSLRIYGGPGEGDSGLIRLAPNWKSLPHGKGYRYSDKTQSAGGIRSIVLHKGKGGGHIKIAGGSANWAYAITGPQTVVTVTLTIGQTKLCAQFADPKNKTQRVSGDAPDPLSACPCEKFDSTWEAIQTVIFQRDGCTDTICHGSDEGAANSGHLKLTTDVAFDQLVKHPSDLVPTMNRVEPGSPTNDSFLYRKLAAKTKGLADVPGTPMPQNLPAISADELEALRLWIQFSAQKDGVVTGTEQLLNSCLPAAKPPHLDPPAPPAAGTGVQYYAPKWNLKPHSEDEVCYATYSDLTNQVPDEYKTPCPDIWGGPTQTCYFFNKNELTQEPNSHHSIIHIYRGKFIGNDSSFDNFCQRDQSPDADGLPRRCDPGNPGVAAPAGNDCGAGSTCVAGFNFHCGGVATGAPCDPRDPSAACGTDTCTGVVKSSLACLTYGPPDFTDVNSAQGGGSANAPSVGGSQQPFARNVYPGGVYGIYPLKGVWVWNSHAFNLTDDPTYNQQWYNVYFAPPDDRQYFIRTIFDSTDIFVENIPSFQETEYCRSITFGVGTRLFELSSHTHKRGRMWREWGPGMAPHCRSTTADPSLCTSETTPPLFTTTQYNDPTQFKYDTPLALDDPDPAQRTFKFCSMYDNGYTDPSTVKRNSTSPISPSFGLLNPFGGPCYAPPIRPDGHVACVDGPKKGQDCHGDDSACDAPGYTAPLGTCDACPLTGGVTTEDEMFIGLGSFYCDPSAPGNMCTYGQCDGGPKWGQACTGTPGECGAGHHCADYIN